MTPKQRCANCGESMIVQEGSILVCMNCQNPIDHAEVPGDDINLPT